MRRDRAVNAKSTSEASAGGLCPSAPRRILYAPPSIRHRRLFMAMLFDTRQFVSECRDAASASDAVTATRAVVREAVRALASGAVALPPLDSIHARHGGGLLLGHDRTLFEDDAVTVAVVETEPGHFQPPHDHSMCAVIGVFEGGERNPVLPAHRQPGAARDPPRRSPRRGDRATGTHRTRDQRRRRRAVPRAACLSGSARLAATVAVSSGDRYRGAVRLRHLSVLRARGLSAGRSFG